MSGVRLFAAEDSRRKLYRYIARPAVSEKRLLLSPQARVRYQLKAPWRTGTTHVEFEPIEFIATLAALVPPPRARLTSETRGRVDIRPSRFGVRREKAAETESRYGQ